MLGAWVLLQWLVAGCCLARTAPLFAGRNCGGPGGRIRVLKGVPGQEDLTGSTVSDRQLKRIFKAASIGELACSLAGSRAKLRELTRAVEEARCRADVANCRHMKTLYYVTGGAACPEGPGARVDSMPAAGAQGLAPCALVAAEVAGRMLSDPAVQKDWCTKDKIRCRRVEGYRFSGDGDCAPPVPVLDTAPADLAGVPCALAADGIFSGISVQMCKANPDACNQLAPGLTYEGGNGCGAAAGRPVEELDSEPQSVDDLRCRILDEADRAAYHKEIAVKRCSEKGTCDQLPSGDPGNKAGWTSTASSVFSDEVATRSTSFAHDGHVVNIDQGLFISDYSPMNWIQFDLGETVFVKGFKLQGRTDCCTERNQHLEVRAGMAGLTAPGDGARISVNEVCFLQGATPANLLEEDCARPIKARYVTVQRVSSDNDNHELNVNEMDIVTLEF